MDNMLNFERPEDQSPIIKVMGVGGGGSNAVRHMYLQGIKGVDFYICNTDAQALYASEVPNKISLGQTGRGAGSDPTKGREAAIDNYDKFKEILSNSTSMLFITAGMGGGTGTGAAPVIAQIAKELGILTVAIVTLPFDFEGRKREKQALSGIEELKQHVDSFLIINNDKILNLDGDIKMRQAFAMSDEVLSIAAKSIAEVVSVSGEINVDFEDVRTVMKDSGKAIMGTGEATGENRAAEALEKALTSPLLDETNIKGANKVLLRITSGKNDISKEEFKTITTKITEVTDNDENVIFGTVYDENLDDELRVTVIATGFDRPEVKRVDLNEPIIEQTKHIPLQNKFIKEERTQPVTKNIEVKQLEVLSIEKSEPKIAEQVATPFQNKTVELKPIDIQPVISNKIDEQPKVEIKAPTKTLFSEPKVEETVKTPAPIVIPEPKQTISYPEQTVFNLDFNVETTETPMNDVSNDNFDNDISDVNSFQFEFDNVSRKESFAPAETNFEKKEVEDNNLILNLEEERRAKLRQQSYQIKFQKTIEELENVPAYVRMNVDIDNSVSNHEQISRFNLARSENNSVELRENNSFLEDNVD